MKAADIFGVDDVEFVEPSYSLQPDESYTILFQSEPAEEGRIAIDENDWPIGMALRTGDKWRVTSFMYRKPDIEVIELMDDLDADIVRTSSESWAEAVREHFSLRLLKDATPAIEDFSSDRAIKVKDLMNKIWPDAKGETCLDCGCGSGMGSTAIKALGMIPLAYDNDPSLLALGLKKGRLVPANTMLIDAALATSYIRPCRFGMALMAGTITNQTTMIWKAILDELMTLTDESLVTVETEREVELVRLWALGKGRDIEIFENDRDPFYDRWVCLSKDKG